MDGYVAAETKTVTIESGETLAYREVGRQGSIPLVLLPHFRGSLDSWDPALIDGLATYRRPLLIGALVLELVSMLVFLFSPSISARGAQRIRRDAPVTHRRMAGVRPVPRADADDPAAEGRHRQSRRQRPRRFRGTRHRRRGRGGPVEDEASAPRFAGGLAILVGIMFFLASIAATSLPLLWVGAIIGGAGLGGAFTGTIRSLVPLVEAQERAGVFSAIYLVSYITFGVPVIVAGLFLNTIGSPPSP